MSVPPPPPPQSPLPLPPPNRPRTRRRTPQWRVPGYGVGYNPAWPSILSIAHDETDGGRLFVVTDRPCVLVGSAAALPLGVAGLSVVDATSILPVKFRLSMSGAVPQGAAWTWGPGAGNDLVDPITNNPLNPASGHCADVPGPFAPAAVSILSITATGGATVIVAFSGPVTVDDTVGPDTALEIEGGNHVQAVAQLDANRVTVDFTDDVTAGQEWALSGQPNWLITPVDPVDEGGFVAA